MIKAAAFICVAVFASPSSAVTITEMYDACTNADVKAADLRKTLTIQGWRTVSDDVETPIMDSLTGPLACLPAGKNAPTEHAEMQALWTRTMVGSPDKFLTLHSKGDHVLAVSSRDSNMPGHLICHYAGPAQSETHTLIAAQTVPYEAAPGFLNAGGKSIFDTASVTNKVQFVIDIGACADIAALPVTRDTFVVRRRAKTDD